MTNYINTDTTEDVKGVDEVNEAARKAEVCGKHILVVEDTVDTGKTMKALLEKLLVLGAASVKTAVTFHKRNPKIVEIGFRADYLAFEIPNVFAVGYGLDYNG